MVWSGAHEQVPKASPMALRDLISLTGSASALAKVAGVGRMTIERWCSFRADDLLGGCALYPKALVVMDQVCLEREGAGFLEVLSRGCEDVVGHIVKNGLQLGEVVTDLPPGRIYRARHPYPASWSALDNASSELVDVQWLLYVGRAKPASARVRVTRGATVGLLEHLLG